MIALGPAWTTSRPRLSWTRMAEPLTVSVDVDEAVERRIRVAKTIVLTIAGIVAVTLVTAFVFGVYNYATDRPAKELFLGR